MSSAEENKALVRRYMEAQAKGDLDALAEMLAPNLVDHSLLPGQTPGREGMLQGIAEDYAALSPTAAPPSGTRQPTATT